MLQTTWSDRNDRVRVFGTRKANSIRGYNERFHPYLEVEGWSNRRLLLRRRNVASSFATICSLCCDIFTAGHELWKHFAYGRKSTDINQSSKWKFIYEAVSLFFLFVQGTLMLKSQDENLYLLYFLRGRSLPPRVTEKISRQFPAKTRYTELLPVHNWLNTQQRFQCKIELLTNDNTQSQVIDFYSVDIVCSASKLFEHKSLTVFHSSWTDSSI